MTTSGRRLGEVGGRGEVLVVGDLMVDVVVAHDQPIAAESDTAARITMRGGGSAANTACWLDSVGRGACLVCAVGDDAIGRQAVDELGQIRTHIQRSELATGCCVVLVDRAGRRTMFPDRGANEDLDLIALGHELGAASARDRPHLPWLHLSAYTLLSPGSRAAAQHALGLARTQDIRVSVDASSAAPILAVGAREFLTWVGGIELLFANEIEVDALGGDATILDHVGALVTKRGADGARWTNGELTAEVPAVAAEVVDTTGAGDAFAAGYLDALLDGADPERCLDAGAGLAAVAIGLIGGRPPVR